ncbi:hypothetical protein N657DRAFT_658783 [Parathielavia appendiculata]|uniref:Zn(2)-C6 fungal-type domain-containing protein n=1 Tax=Parathielavia appendiculata TaxID=2587402 RepID=A0AAN6TT47_9PEZI|nr:hypothetical protein N657DRAFT_658783 [Parathielavia appendiculata]
MARLRLGYTKSRTGCLRCKQRRVKCDETKPSCKACVRHGVECSLSLSTDPNNANSPSPASSANHAGIPSPGPSPGPQSHLAPSRRSRPRSINPKPSDNPPFQPPPSITVPPGDLHGPEAEPSPHGSALTMTGSPLATTPDPFPYLAKFVTGPPEEDTADWVFDLELLHHFTTCTYPTFMIDRSRTETNRMWQIEVPKQAFVHVFLLHQILAIASYHLAYLHPQSRQAYALRASHHQNAGIRLMRVALSDISPANCHALFVSSSLLFIGSLAASSSTKPSADGPTVDDLVDVLMLVKGMGSVLDSSKELLRSGPLSELFVLHACPDQLNPALDRVVLAVGDFLVEIAETEPDAHVRATVHADAYRMVTAIREALGKSAGPEYHVVAAWPIHMSDDLIPLLRQRNQAALALLSYYCVVFHAAELQGYWFMRGWAPGVIRDISRTMAGPWKRHSAWALGWITGHAAIG